MFSRSLFTLSLVVALAGVASAASPQDAAPPANAPATVQWNEQVGSLSLRYHGTVILDATLRAEDAGGQKMPVVVFGADDAKPGTSPLDGNNVVWESPSKDSAGSMPTGNGDIGLNLWAEADGDLLFYIGKTDAWTGDWKLAKLGRVRVHLEPNPFRQGLPFRQEMKLLESEIAIVAGPQDNPVRLRVWVDANHPVIHVEAESAVAFDMRVTMENWRGAADRFLQDQKDRVVWYHRNDTSPWRGVLTYQHLEPLIDKLGLKDLLMHRTFGGIMMGEGLVPDGNATLKSAKPATKHRARIHVLKAQTTTAEEWLEQVESNAARYEALPAAQVRQDHLKYWEDFWNRSWIHISGAEDAKVPSQCYALQRYITACAGRGTQPIKFNGSIFVDGRDPNDGAKPYDPDSRAWGPHYWFQNTRLIYWPLLATGDRDQMRPLFRMYRDILPLALERTKIYYGHDGAFFPETQDFWGTYRNGDYGAAVNGEWVGHGYPPAPPGTDWEKIWNNPRQGKPVGEVLSKWIRYEYCGGLELSAMMLDYFDYTGDREFASATLVPIADAVLQFYYEHYPRDGSGRLRIYPSAALENGAGGDVVANPMDAVAGLHRVIPGLLALPAELSSAAQRARWETWRKELPPMPMATEGGMPILGTEESGTKRYGRESPELYPVFPYRLYGVGKPDLEMARHTFNTRKNHEEKGWRQEPVQAAYLGLTKEARRLAVRYLTTHDQTRRFPAFWGPNYDGTPDQTHGGNGLMALQRMLLHADDGKILLFPAWPKDWDVDFRLHAPMNTTVRAVYRGGKMVTLNITPETRRKDVMVMDPQ